MNKHIFISKQGLFFRFISVLLQSVIMSPVIFIISFFASSIIIEYYDFNSIKLLLIVMAVLDLIWIMRNSIVKVTEDEIIMRNWIGGKTVVGLNEISSIKILKSKELKKICWNRTGVDPLITNCFSILIPIGNTVYFKNRFGRDVVIGVWNSDKLYRLINEKNNRLFVEDNQSQKVNQKSISNNKCNYYDKKVSYYFLKIPMLSHISTFLKHLFETIIYPLFILALFWIFFKILDMSINFVFYIIIFILVSFFEYLKIIRVTVNVNTQTIKLNFFTKTDKNVIKYETVSNLRYVDSIKDIELLKQDSSKFVIATPYCKNSIDNIIAFDIDNDISVALSVNKTEEFYNLIDTNNKHQDLQ